MKGEADGITVIDDYAHHPQEIAATVAAARERYPDGGSLPPSNRTRIAAPRPCWIRFAHALGAADCAVVLDIYPARETDSLGVSSDDIIRRMNSETTIAGGTPAQAIDRLAREARDGDVILTLGAGDVTLVGPKLLALLKEQS